ncbi:MAG: hypothetical protein O2809_00815 [Proteobacteria bacterium]|nr:hypothetical protein [Pseudomonadota bacterium]
MNINLLPITLILGLSGCASTHVIKDKDAPINYSYAVYNITSKPISLTSAFNDIKVYFNQYGSDVEVSTAAAAYPLPIKPNHFQKVSASFFKGGFKLDSQGDTLAACKGSVFKSTYTVKDVKTLMCVFAYQKGYSVNFISQTHDIDWSSMNQPSIYGAQLIANDLTAKSVSQHALGIITDALNQEAALQNYYPVATQPKNLIQSSEVK